LIALLAFRWRLFLGQQQIVIPFRTVFSLSWAGQFFNSVLPGSTGGDVVKIYQLCRLVPERKAAVAASVVADRLTALAALVSLAGVGILIEPGPLQLVLNGRLTLRSVIGWTLSFAAMGALAAWLLWRFLRATSLAGRIHRVLSGVGQCFVFNRRLGIALLSAFALHILNFSIVYLFAHSLGLTLTYGQALLIMPVVLFIVMVPITINGHGLREVLLIAYFGAMGVTNPGHPDLKVQDTAVALSLLSVGNDLLWSLPGGIWYFLRVRRTEPTAVDYKPVN
jgi:uncharacterized membrane protein YbhN (UPF0104 family)